MQLEGGQAVGKLATEQRLPRHEALKDAISVLRSRVEELKSLRDDIRNTPQTPEGVRDSRSLNSLSDILEFGPLEINELTQQINGVLGDLREILL